MLKRVVDKIEDVPEAFRSEYKEGTGALAGKFVVDLEGGLKTEEDVTKLTGALAKERNDHGALKKVFEPYKALGDVEKVQEQLLRIPELEIAAAGNVDDKKVDKLVEARLAAKVAPIERELTTTKTALAAATGEIQAFKTEKTTRQLQDAARSAAAKVKVLDTATDDVLMLAERMLEVDAAGNVVTKDNVGVTPGVSAEVWLSDMQTKRPHWWPASGGGGAGGASGGGGGGANPFAYDTWNLTEQGRILMANPTKAEQLAKAAGTKIGGGKPPAPKKA